MAAATITLPDVGDKRATVVAVHGARGGVGATFVATHLAQAFACRGLDCVLIDGDLTYGDVSAAIGVPLDDVHTIADLLPLVNELSGAHSTTPRGRTPAGFPCARGARSGARRERDRW